MFGTKTLSEIRKEISERLKEAGIDERQFREQLRKLRPAKRKKPLTVAKMLGLPETPASKKRRRVISKSR